MKLEKIIVIVCVILLTMFGLVLNASVITTNGVFNFYKMVIIVLISFSIMILTVNFFTYEFFKKKWLYTVGGIFFLISLILVLFYGTTKYGSVRWFKLGYFSFQPSEFFKPYLVLLISYVIYRYHKNEKVQLFAYIYITIVALLVLIEPDLGTFVFYMLFSSIMFYMAGIYNMKKIYSILVVFALAGLVVTILYFRYQPVKKRINKMIAYQSSRVKRYINMNLSDDNSSVSIRNSQQLFVDAHSVQYTKVSKTIENATWWGLGFSQGLYTKYLPAKHNDYITILALEEAGIAGVLVLGVLFLILFFSILKISFAAESVFVHYITLGVGIMIFLQALLHFGVNFQVFPEKGISLPFVSYGGSSYLTNIIMIAFVLKARVKG